MNTVEGLILTPAAWLRGRLTHDAGRILALQGETVGEDEWRTGDAPILLPGFIDLHVHGGGGADVMQGGDAVHTLARTHALFGTTALLATTMTAPHAEIETALRAVAAACVARSEGAARVLGVHLEGPYISPDKLGAQPAFAVAPSAAEILALAKLAPIRVVTLAPEMPGALKTDSTLVRGCSASVWVYPTVKGDCALNFLADSNAAITKGIIALVLMSVQDQSPATILATDIEDALAPFDLKNQLSSNRTQGIPNMIALIKETAGRYRLVS